MLNISDRWEVRERNSIENPINCQNVRTKHRNVSQCCCCDLKNRYASERYISVTSVRA